MRLRSRCGAAHIFGHGGHLQAQGKPPVLVVDSQLFLTGARDRSGFTSTFEGQGLGVETVADGHLLLVVPLVGWSRVAATACCCHSKIEPSEP